MLDFLDRLRRGDERHPLHSVEAAKALVAALPADDMHRFLGELAQWLRSVAEAPDFRPTTRLAVIELLDDAGRAPERALMLRYFKDPRLRSASGRFAWTVAHEFWAALAEAYARCARESLPAARADEAVRGPLAAIAARAIRARAGEMRLRMLHYEPLPAASWEGLYGLILRCEHAGLLDAPTHAYPREARYSTPLAEAMKCLLVAIAAPERLPPEEIDAAWRIAERFAGAGRLSPEPFAGATHALDLAAGVAPARLDARAPRPPAPGLRYLGAQEALAKLARMIAHQELSMLDEDARLAREFSPGQKVTVLRQFLKYWGATPPPDERGLVELREGLVVAHGFHTVCHYLPHAANVGLADEDAAEFEPLETWPLREAGRRVLHAIAPPPEGDWAEVGTLAALRAADAGQWWLAVIRRLEMGAGGVLQAEFELLSKKPVSVWLRVLGPEDRMAGHWESATGALAYEHVEAIVLADGASRTPTLVLPRGRFIPGLVAEVLHGTRSRFAKLTELFEQGKDYDWCALAWRADPRARADGAGT
ncbi:MAG: hypothetical protein N2653_10700 [Burkholderiales bacterium]|nr:hypothetical protein [Burkholderiales bacterium]